MINRKEAFEMWLHRRMLRIPWTDMFTNTEVLRRAGLDRELLAGIKRRKMLYLRHTRVEELFRLAQDREPYAIVVAVVASGGPDMTQKEEEGQFCVVMTSGQNGWTNYFVRHFQDSGEGSYERKNIKNMRRRLENVLKLSRKG